MDLTGSRPDGEDIAARVDRIMSREDHSQRLYLAVGQDDQQEDLIITSAENGKDVVFACKPGLVSPRGFLVLNTVLADFGVYEALTDEEFRAMLTEGLSEREAS